MANAVNTHAFFEGFTQFPAVIAKGLALRDGEVFREISTPRMSGFSAQKQHDAARILALELAGVEIIDPPEPEDWYRDEDEDMDMDDFYPSIPQP